MSQPYPTPQHEALAAVAGDWAGTTRLYFEPGVLHSEDPITATAKATSGGHAIQLSYAGHHGEDRTNGTMLISYDAAGDRHSVAWVDSFHSSTLMLSTGARTPDSLVAVQGSYTAEGQTWGWHTTLALDAPDALALRMYNVIPGEAPALAVETLLRRQ